MKQLILTAALALVQVLGAQTRSWGFSKDTVYETSYMGKLDSVLLRNNGPDTLKVDSGLLEIIKPVDMDTAEMWFNPLHVQTVYQMKFTKTNNKKSSLLIPSRIILGQNRVDTFDFFSIDWPIFVPALSKSASASGPRDTIIARIIFENINKVRDTVILKGIWENKGVVGLARHLELRKPLSNRKYVDPLGRTQGGPSFWKRFWNMLLASPKNDR